jgi:RNA polymerase sigma-70 factor (ECF subfamily)
MIGKPGAFQTSGRSRDRLRPFAATRRIPNAVMIYQAAIDESFPVAEPPTHAARLRTADPTALAETVGYYQHRLYRYLLRLVRDQASADDLFQQTWLHVVRQLHRYDAARSFDTWLFAIAHNAAMDLLRRRPGESLDDSESALPSSAPDALAGVLAGERAAILATAMAALPALCREALTLRFEEGMKLEEIAEVTHAPLSTVKSRVRRGLEAMKHKLSKEELL